MARQNDFKKFSALIIDPFAYLREPISPACERDVVDARFFKAVVNVTLLKK